MYEAILKRNRREDSRYKQLVDVAKRLYHSRLLDIEMMRNVVSEGTITLRQWQSSEVADVVEHAEFISLMNQVL